MASLLKNPVKWVEDTAHSAGNALGIKNVSWSTPLGRNSELSNLGSNINREWNNASRGELGRYVADFGESFYNSLLFTPRLTGAAVTGGDVGKELTRGVGGIINTASFGADSYIGQSSFAQKTLNSKFLDTVTLGLSGDYAGFTKGVSQSKSGHVDKEYLDDTLRLGGKIALIATGTYAAQGGFSAAPAASTPVYPGGATMINGAGYESLASTGALYQSPGAAVAAQGWTWGGLASSAYNGAAAVGKGALAVAKGGVEVLTSLATIRALTGGSNQPSQIGENLIYGPGNSGPDLGFLDDLFGYRGGGSSPVVINPGVQEAGLGVLPMILIVGAIGGTILMARFKK